MPKELYTNAAGLQATKMKFTASTSLLQKNDKSGTILAKVVKK